MFEINCGSFFTDILKETQGMLFCAHLHQIYRWQMQSIPKQDVLSGRERVGRWLPKKSKILWDCLSYSCSKGVVSGSSGQQAGSVTCFSKGFPPSTNS